MKNISFGLEIDKGTFKEQWDRQNLYCPKCGHYGLWERYGDRICAECKTLYLNENDFEAFDIETEEWIKVYEAVKKFEEDEVNAPKELT